MRMFNDKNNIVGLLKNRLTADYGYRLKISVRQKCVEDIVAIL